MDMHGLIYEVRRRPALWDSAHPDHANRPETQRLWNAVAEAVGLGVDVCRSKWKNLRCSYRRKHRRSGNLSLHQSPTPGHQWTYAEAMTFLDGQRILKEDRDSSNNEEEEMDSSLRREPLIIMPNFKRENTSASDEMEADNDALMREFQNVSTPQALRQLSENISLASAAAEEQLPQSGLKIGPGISINPNLTHGSALAAAAANSCHCAKRVDEQVNFLENLEREEQQLMQSTSQDLARSKSVLHVGDSDYNYLVSFLPMMKQMTPIQNVFFRAKMGELLLQTMQQPPMQPQSQSQQLQQLHQQQQQQQQKQQPQQQQPSQMLLNQQQMALDQAQVSTSSTNWS
ncbi:myb-like protein AA [Drosophila eugracilis]|uniref:myb-like protein AA n=1 Tax=Drosophila eugracilis TaxID=29029 RepID=UPI0007E800D4|nr:myb-like protein AA [Drosophila eugracilis]